MLNPFAHLLFFHLISNSLINLKLNPIPLISLSKPSYLFFIDLKFFQQIRQNQIIGSFQTCELQVVSYEL